MRSFAIFSILALFLFSCGNSVENRTTKEYLSAMLNENKAIAVFGKVDLHTLLAKSEYKAVPKLGMVVAGVLENFQKSLKLETPVYYAVEGPFSTEGVPAAFYGLFEVVNADSLVQNLTKQGYDFEKDGELNYTQFGELSLGIENNLAILVSKDGEYEAKKMLNSAFDQAKGDVSEGKVAEMLDEEGDVLLAVNIESIYGSSNTELSKLSKEKQKEIEEMVADSYSQTSFKFENGEAIIETKNYFSDALKAKMFLNSNADAPILSKLGHGSPLVGLSLNLDMNKLQGLMDDYSPEALKSLGEMMGGPAQMALMMGGDKALSGLFTGEIGFVMVGEPGMNGSMIPDFNAYVGLGDKGHSLAEMAKGFLSNGSMQVDVNSKGIACYSSPAFAPVSGKKLNIPAGFEMFGKKGFTAFVNFEGMDMSSFELEGAAKALNLVKYITIEADVDGAKVIIKAKKGKENVLKQTIQFYMKEFESQITGLSI